MAPRLLQCLADPRLQALLDPTLVILEVPKRAEVCEERRLGVRSGLLRYLQIEDQGFLAGNEASGLRDTFSSSDQSSVLSRHCGRGGQDFTKKPRLSPGAKFSRRRGKGKTQPPTAPRSYHAAGAGLPEPLAGES